MSEKTQTHPQTQPQGTLSIESNNIFTILKKWLYTEPDIVFRELISNATDAIEKRNLTLQENGSLPIKGRIQVTLDKENHTLTISDNGIGMDYEEVHKYINNIAFSGAEDFIKANNESGRNSIIGHFGVGFYSAFMLADHVAIETKSYKENTPAVRWDCTSDMNYDMKPCKKEHPGTDIILYLSEDNPYLSKPELALESIRKYFIFSRYDIFFTTDGTESAAPINNTAPIWRKAKEDIQKEEMNDFYKDYFNETSDPLFWIQFSSIDIGVRGILFFRNTRNGTEELDGQIHVFNRGIYVGKNIPELIPKFVNLQSGIIECDNLPLVVSRSAIQNDDSDQLLKLVYECLSQEVTIALYEIFQNERALYETHWPEINAFVKYGILQDKTFSSVMMKRVIFEDVNGTYQTVDEYLNEDPESQKKTIYYSSDRLDQAHYISIFKKCGVNALLFDHVIDQALLYKYETVYPKCKFIRIDSNIDEIYGGLLKDGDEEKIAALTEIITTTLGDRLGNINLRFTRLEDESISALIVNDETTRRMADMMEIYGYMNRADTSATQNQVEKSLLFNLNNPMVKNIESSAGSVKSQLVIQQLFDLALLSQQALQPEDMEAFISRSELLLQYCQ